MTFTASLQPIKPVSPALWHTPNKNRNCKSFTTTQNEFTFLPVCACNSYSSTGSSYNVFRLKSLLPRGMGFSVSHTCDLCEPGRRVPNLNMRNELKSSTRPLGSITVVTQPLESHGKDITQPGISNPQKLTSHCLCCNPRHFWESPTLMGLRARERLWTGKTFLVGLLVPPFLLLKKFCVFFLAICLGGLVFHCEADLGVPSGSTRCIHYNFTICEKKLAAEVIYNRANIVDVVNRQWPTDRWIYSTQADI